MDHGPAVKWKENEKASKVKTKIGIWMFLGYLIIYAAFIVINVTNPKLMGSNVGSVNLAIVFGFGLIFLALVMALIYNALCGIVEQKGEKEISAKETNEGGN